MTLDNEEATILVGQEIPITTGEVAGRQLQPLPHDRAPERRRQADREAPDQRRRLDHPVPAPGGVQRQRPSLTDSANDLVPTNARSRPPWWSTTATSSWPAACWTRTTSFGREGAGPGRPPRHRRPVPLHQPPARPHQPDGLHPPDHHPQPRRRPGLAADRWGYMRQQQLNNAPGASPAWTRCCATTCAPSRRRARRDRARGRGGHRPAAACPAELRSLRPR